MLGLAILTANLRFRDMAKQNVLTRGKKQRAQALLQAGQLEEARILCAQVCEKDRNDVDAWSMLGLIHLRQRRYQEAEHCWQRQLSLNPQAVDALLNLAGIYAQRGKFEQATRYCHQAIQIQPANINAHYNLGNAYRLQREYQQAIEAYQQALKLQPHHPGTLLNLGLSLSKQGMYHEAIDCYQKMLKANPSAMDASNNLAAVYLAMGQLDDAITHRRQFLQRQTNFILGRSNLLLTLNYSPAISSEAMFQEHLRWGELVMGQSRQTPTHANRPDKERRLRIGYVSPDFVGQHSVTYFIESLLANHDRERFEIFAMRRWAFRMPPPRAYKSYVTTGISRMTSQTMRSPKRSKRIESIFWLIWRDTRPLPALRCSRANPRRCKSATSGTPTPRVCIPWITA